MIKKTHQPQSRVIIASKIEEKDPAIRAEAFFYLFGFYAEITETFLRYLSFCWNFTIPSTKAKIV